MTLTGLLPWQISLLTISGCVSVLNGNPVPFKILTKRCTGGQMPWLDYWLDKNPVVALGPPNISNVTRIAVENLTARLKGEDKNFDPDTPDFLQYFIESKDTHPEVVNEGTIIGYLLLNRTFLPLPSPHLLYAEKGILQSSHHIACA